MEKTDKTSLAADLSLFVVAATWGSGFIASQWAIDADMGASLILAVRFSVAAVILAAVFFPSLKKITRRDWLTGLPAGLLLFTAFFAQTAGLLFTTPSNNAFLTSTNVVMVPFISWALLRKAPKPKAFILALICMAGIGVLTWSPGTSFNPGDLLTLLCALLFAGHIAYLDVASRKVDAGSLTFMQMAAAAVLSILSLFLLEPASIARADFRAGIPPVLYLGIFSTCICFLIQTAAQKRTTSSKAALYLSTEALFGASFSVLLGLEPFTASLLIGGGVIMTTIILAETKLF